MEKGREENVGAEARESGSSFDAVTTTAAIASLFALVALGDDGAMLATTVMALAALRISIMGRRAGR